MRSPIYLDYQASTPVDPRVLDAMLPHLRSAYGNPSSGQHDAGRRAAGAVDQARTRVAALLGARPQEVVFTSGATEANNLALRGLAAASAPPAHIITCATEHPAVLEPLRALEREGWSVTYLAVDAAGRLDLEELRRSFRPDTALVSLMAANNEIGALHPIRAISAIAHENGVLVHSDAAQAVGKIALDVERLGVDLLSISGHKLYGPQGVGALYVRRGIRSRLRPLLYGGGQEGGLRSGTLNTPGIVGLGVASDLAAAELQVESERVAVQRDRLRDLLDAGSPDMRENGPPASDRLPGCLHVSFPGAEADAVMANCPDVAMASGSACSSAAPGPSHVLSATGMSADLADASLRLSIGRFTTDQELEAAAEFILRAVARVRELTAPSTSAIGMATA